MRVRVLFFGVLKDVVGFTEETLDLDDGARLSAVWEHYAARFPRLHSMASSVALAHNRRFAQASAELADGDEVALLPPVSGGLGAEEQEVSEPRCYIALTRRPIDLQALAAGFARPEDGAVVTFQGVVRNHSQGRAVICLDYECYEPMALEVMAALGRELAERHGLGRIAMVHRLGRLNIGEVSVAIVAGAPHRQAAFEAVTEAVTRLKRQAPIWKKEHFAEGERWVEGEWEQSLLER